jgi:putative DNA methylase
VAKASAKPRTAGTTKKKQLDAAIAEAVGAGLELHLESVNFSDPQRPKTCLEVDFPIIPVNRVSTLEASSGAATKPVYQMGKWWARRQSSVFRTILLAAATRAPDDDSEAAKLVWDSYYGNHQRNEAYRKIRVADIFMGGGTTIVEGARLGMQMYGNDLNPVAWLNVKNECAHPDLDELARTTDLIESEVKPKLQPFYACDCPCGHKGVWRHRSHSHVMGQDFDPLSTTPEERRDYEYSGPTVIYTFWAKHGPCQASGCHHRTPLMSSPVVAARVGDKALSVKAWRNWTCTKCHKHFDIELTHVRLAPRATLVISANEAPFCSMDDSGNYTCPHCHTRFVDEAARITGKSDRLGKPTEKKVPLTVLVHPTWMKGSPSLDEDGASLGGSVDSSVDTTHKWLLQRSAQLKLIEVRGTITGDIAIPGTNEVIATSDKAGTITGRSEFACQAETCGQQQDVLDSIKKTGTTGPMAPYAVQVYCPTCDASKTPGNGRYYDVPNTSLYSAAYREWHDVRNQLFGDYWPHCELSHGWKTHGWAIPEHGYTHYWKMFNARQLYVHASLLRSIDKFSPKSETRELLLNAFTHHLRCNCLFTIWHLRNSQISAFLSNNSYQAKNTVVETSPFSPVGDGSWLSGLRGVFGGIEWQKRPWEIVANSQLKTLLPREAVGHISGQSTKVLTGDPVEKVTLTCESATALTAADGSFDLVITDPPFGELMQYSELSDFFYVWLRLVLKDSYPQLFDPPYTPKALEVVTNPYRNEDPTAFYQRLLTTCWREAARLMKPGAILAFSFHHEKDEPWISVLESLFDAGLYLEAAYPVRSDTSKGEEKVAFGAEKVEYDIIHVCRKRIEQPAEISWARLRRQIVQDVQQLQHILEHHQKDGLQQADLQVIRRGKALEYFSKHYGKVYIEKGREFTVREALAGINQLLDDQQDAKADVPPVDAEPYTRQFLRLFADTSAVPRDQMQKYLRGTGISPTEFEDRGWCKEVKKVFHLASPLVFAQQWKGKPRQGMGRDFDQAFFLIGGCFENSGIRVHDTLNSQRFEPHIATGLILEWFTRHGGDAQTRDAAKVARQIYSAWEASNDTKVKAAQRTFDFLEAD